MPATRLSHCRRLKHNAEAAPAGAKDVPVTRLMAYSILAAAIVAEVIATTALARTESFTRLVPTVIAVVGYLIAFFLLSFTLRVMPAGVVYAIWSGAGIVLIALVAWLLLGQKLDLAAIVGLAFIIAGVFILNVFSKATLH